jgi:hypothetical protein
MMNVLSWDKALILDVRQSGSDQFRLRRADDASEPRQ